MNQLEMTGLLGEKILISFADDAERLHKQREWGGRGFTTGEAPRGGYILPYCMAETFDWSLIGARKWKTPEGEEVILHRGHSYKIRHMEGVDSKKMTLPPCVKVSRGAKPTDPDHLREKSDGEIEYVTLAVFRGSGKAIEGYEAPQGQQQRPQQQRQPEPEVMPRARDWNTEWKEAVTGSHYGTPEGREQVAQAVSKHLSVDGDFNALWLTKREDVRDCLITTAKSWIAEDRKQASD